MSVGSIIKKFRKYRNITQKQLGEKSGINETQIRKYEINSRNPKKEQLNKLASALNINKFEFFEFDDTLTMSDLITLLFKLDEKYPLNIQNTATGLPAICMNEISDFLMDWKIVKEKISESNMSIEAQQQIYNDWKYKQLMLQTNTPSIIVNEDPTSRRERLDELFHTYATDEIKSLHEQMRNDLKK